MIEHNIYASTGVPLGYAKYLSTAGFSPALQILLQSRNKMWKWEMDCELLLALSV